MAENTGNNQELGIHWADQTALSLIKAHPDKDTLVCAAGISPSGTVHIGNFREVITVDLVVRALRNRGRKVRFIYSWDDCDALRKIPKNLPHQEKIAPHLRKPIARLPDPFEADASYAAHFEKIFERELQIMGVKPEYIYQHQAYFRGDYKEGILTALEHEKEIVEILNAARTSPLEENWTCLTIFCDTCGKDTTTLVKHVKPTAFHYTCECSPGEKVIDLASAREENTGCVKLLWRVDWPMRWAREKVDFEPGGKDHSSEGGSYDTGSKIVEKVWKFPAPQYRQYDMVKIKGLGARVSSSSGNVITISELLEVYEPQILRWLFASRKPNMDFSIAFDLDVVKAYDDFDRTERIALGVEEAEEKKRGYEEGIYKMSLVDPTDFAKNREQPPAQVSFRHLCSIVQIYQGDIGKAAEYFSDVLKTAKDKDRFQTRARCAWNWVSAHAPEDFRFRLREAGEETPKTRFPEAVRQVVAFLEKGELPDEGATHSAIYEIVKSHHIQPKEFFQDMYGILIGRPQGPKLASFLKAIGGKKSAEILSRSL